MINMTTQNVNKIWVLLAKRKQKGYCIDQTGTSQILMVTQSPGDLVKIQILLLMCFQVMLILLICGSHKIGHKLWTIAPQLLILLYSLFALLVMFSNDVEC